MKTTVLESLFNKVAGLKSSNFIKKGLQHRYFLVNIAKFLKSLFLQNTSGDCFWAKEKARDLMFCSILIIRNIYSILKVFHWYFKELRADLCTMKHANITNSSCLKINNLSGHFYITIFCSFWTLPLLISLKNGP